jgi:peptide/nickel transport system substrate-binding protein
MISRSIAASVAIAAVAVLAACGGDNSGDKGAKKAPSPSDSSGATAIKPGKAGGKLKVLSSADVDYLDPGQTYYTFGYMVHYAVNRTLYSFKPDDPEKPVPDLATGPPEISPDNKTVTVHIKPAIKYAPPVNRAVKAQDVKYAFERSFSKEVPSG